MSSPYLLGRFQRRSEERGIDRRKREAGKKAEDDAASELSRLSGRGLYYVFNNLKDAAPGARGDIDHLVVGPAGIFVVETKGDPGVVTADFSQNPPLLLRDGRPFVSRAGGRPRSFLAQLDSELREVHRNVFRGSVRAGEIDDDDFCAALGKHPGQALPEMIEPAFAGRDDAELARQAYRRLKSGSTVGIRSGDCSAKPPRKVSPSSPPR